MKPTSQIAQDSQISHQFRRIVWRDAPVMPPKQHFVLAGVPAYAAEMTLIRRITRLMPPRANCLCRFGGWTGESRRTELKVTSDKLQEKYKYNEPPRAPR